MEKISVLSAGERFTFKGFEWVTLGQVSGGVFAIMAEPWKELPFDNKSECSNKWSASTLRKTMQDELLPLLGEENLLPHVVNMVADNGDESYGTVSDRVFILTCDEYRKFRKYIPKYDTWVWTATPWWIDENSGGGRYVRNVGPSGALDHSRAVYGRGVAPACIFNPANLKLRRQAQMLEV